MEENNLSEIVSASIPDETLRRIFLTKSLPKELILDLKAVLKTLTVPLAIRSSSMLEDSHYQPFAGVYATCMLPNKGNDEERLKALCDAIISVYASTYYNKSKEYLRATHHMVEEERMANYYPTSHWRRIWNILVSKYFWSCKVFEFLPNRK